MKFIVIDGLDGSGKDTQINLLADFYTKQGKNVVVRSHPCNDNKYGIKSKQALLKTGKINHIKATIYFGLDAIRSVRRYSHDESIDVLIFSRYILAVMYLPSVVNVVVYKIVCFALPTSDTMFFLDVSPEESLRRIGSRDEETEMFENYDSLKKTRENSKKFTYNWVVIDGDKSIDEISSQIISRCVETD
ncbi:thymidylate kinase [Methanobrevibacter millerae]|uniref:dTMP kinase n=1 Tax=Methanobrevibacter millerae TaxID=230361 RepID=A0A1G5XH45_9EURY|nr:thymidylate kinase [Methanobrevibacter millerae]SDA69769.1 dTMP kinase [Methanobrevibacter millerae]